jgi:hypothetical protein
MSDTNQDLAQARFDRDILANLIVGELASGSTEEDYAHLIPKEERLQRWRDLDGQCVALWKQLRAESKQ